MLPVHETVTKEFLPRFATLNPITEQVAIVGIEFVAYNAYAESFAYVELSFTLQPSGYVEPYLDIQTVQLELYPPKDLLSGIRFVLEIFVSILIILYLLMWVKDLRKSLKEAGPSSFGEFLRAMGFFFTSDFFNLLDLYLFGLTI